MSSCCSHFKPTIFGDNFYVMNLMHLLSPFPPKRSSSYCMFSSERMERGCATLTVSSLLRYRTLALSLINGNPSPEMTSSALIPSKSTVGEASYMTKAIPFGVAQ